MMLKFKQFILILLCTSHIHSMYYTLWFNFTKCKQCPARGAFRFDEPYDKDELLLNPYWKNVSKLSQEEKDAELINVVREYHQEEWHKRTSNMHQRDHIAAAIAAGANPNIIDTQNRNQFSEYDPEQNSLAIEITKYYDYQLLKFLLENGADPSFIPYRHSEIGQRTALYYAHNKKTALLLAKYLNKSYLESLPANAVYTIFWQLLELHVEPKLLDFYINLLNTDEKRIIEFFKNLIRYTVHNINLNEEQKKVILEKFNIFLSYIPNLNKIDFEKLSNVASTNLVRHGQFRYWSKETGANIEPTANFFYKAVQEFKKNRQELAKISEDPAFEDYYTLTKVLTLAPKINYIVDEERNSILHVAAKLGNTRIAKIFLMQKPGLLTAKNKFGRMPIHEAALAGKFEVIKLFIGLYPPIIKSKDNDENTIFEYPLAKDNLIKLIEKIVCRKSKLKIVKYSELIE
ncbi:ankyrin repeat domain-containing protein [Candidatus Dependentiae bacterium]|nr:ankyrin repeat domain-containing protein [Candidatus Dependentiae bacterium]